MPITLRAPRLRRIARVALLAPLAFGVAGCKFLHRGSSPATQPAALKWGHGGVMANDTNPPFSPKRTSGSIGTIERLDPRFDALFAPETTMEKLVEGLNWAEGPVWTKGEYLLFSDVPQNVIYKFDARTGLTEFLRPSGYTGTEPRGGEPGSNGLTTDALGRLVLCQHGDRAVSRLLGVQPPRDQTEPMHPVFERLAEKFQGKRFNSPNDLVFDSQGNLYFTDPPYGLPSKDETDPTKEIPFQGVYRMSNHGQLGLMTKEMSRPNGIALSPDERTLYVANSDVDKAVWMAYPIKGDGTLGAGRVFFDATSMAKDKTMKGLPDGMKVDKKGNLFATGPGGVLVFAPDGTHLGTLHTGEATGNCAWGDDGSTLYICADMYLLKIKTLTKGW
jgi:gluconolactonase